MGARLEVMTVTGGSFGVRDRGRSMLAVALAAAAAYHGALLMSGTFRRTYDAFVHIFFADHYARTWFDPWEPRWYTGFTVTSYPPGAHQAVALLSKLFGLQGAYVVVQLAAVLLVVWGVYRFARLWVSSEAAGAAALLAVVATGIGQAVHVFGQLPTMLSLGFLLHALPHVDSWIRKGDRRDLFAGWALLAATTASHHVTTIFGGVFFVGPVVLAALVAEFRTPHPEETGGRPARVTRANLVPLIVRRIRRLWRPMTRLVGFGAGSLAVLVVVILPYWLWSRSDPITQIPIPHASRNNYLTDLNAGFMFWIVPWGPALLALPFAIRRGLASAAWPLTLSLLAAALLGTGGTTPLPRLLLGPAFEILTLDRFTFWAGILALPLLGQVALSVARGTVAPRRSGSGLVGSRLVQATAVVVVIAASVWTGNLAQFRSLQPAPVDPAPIVAFLDKDLHSRWRYLTLGFGDQMAWVSAQTEAQTVDGNYHSARRLPELITTPIERLEGAKFRGIPGLGSLQQFLAVPEKYHLKFVFSNDEFYDPLLAFSGWHRVDTLENDVVVWEREDIPPLPAQLSRRSFPVHERIMWGVLPPLSIAAGLAALAAGAQRVRRTAAARAPRSSSRIEQRFARWSTVPPGPEEESDWRLWRTVRSRFGARIRSIRVPVRLGASLGVLAASAAVAGFAVAPTELPEDVVAAYYEDLDFRRFREAWERLDAASRPTFDEYLLQLSVEDGLVASYSMLDSISTHTTYISGDHAMVTTDLLYVTALAEYPLRRDVELVRSDGQWHIVPESTDPSVPVERLYRRAAVDYGAQGRRTPTTATTTYGDVLDRPELEIHSARLVESADRYVVVGELTNIDVDPADVTVTAQLVDDRGGVLAEYNAQRAILHKVRPRETTPFRIDFEGVAGATDVTHSSAGSFRPDLFTPLELPPDTTIGGFIVYAKAVVTAEESGRSLTIQDVRLADRDGRGAGLEGELLNLGTSDATVPQILLTLYDTEGSVAWVDDHYLFQNVRPGRALPFGIAPTEARDVRPLHTEPTVFVNGLRATLVANRNHTAIPLPQHADFSYLGLTSQAFTRDW